MKIFLTLFLVTLFSCQEKKVSYEFYSNGKLAFEILPSDIEFYDTVQVRSGIEIHELRLRNNFFEKDSIPLVYPMTIVCRIGRQTYFYSRYFHMTQSQPQLYINFHFKSACDNRWTFPEDLNKPRLKQGDTLILHTNNKCNSIEFFHEKDEIEDHLAYYSSRKYFQNYRDTARLAHEILLDPFYIKTLKGNGILVK